MLLFNHVTSPGDLLVAVQGEDSCCYWELQAHIVCWGDSLHRVNPGTPQDGVVDRFRVNDNELSFLGDVARLNLKLDFSYGHFRLSVISCQRADLGRYLPF